MPKSDLQEHQRAVADLRRYNRLLQVLTEINQAVIRATDEFDLLQVVCQTMVEVGGYRYASVELSDDEGIEWVIPVARAGQAPQRIAEVQLGVRVPSGKAVRKALRHRKPVIERATKTNQGPDGDIFACFPLIGTRELLGVLSIVACEPDCLDKQEEQLLAELARDISFGLHTLREQHERERVEIEVRRTKERAQRYFDIAGTILVVLDADGRVVQINDKGCNTLGYRWDEVVGRNWFTSFLPKGIQFDTHEVFRRLMDGTLEPVEFYENSIVRKDGSTRMIAWHNALLRDDSGRITGTLSSGEDITESKRAERELVESEARYRSLVELSPEAILVWREGKILYTNPIGNKLVGLERLEEAVGRSVMDFIHPKYRRAARARLRKMLQDQIAVPSTDMIFLRVDGTPFHVSVVSCPIIYQGQPAILTVIRDVHERKQMDALLAESEARYRQLVEMSPDAITVHQDGKIAYVNAAGVRLVAASSPAELIGTPVLDVVHPDSRAEVVRRVRIMLEEHRSTPLIEEVFLRRDGLPVDVEVIATPIVYEGRPAIQVMARDITERKLAQEALRQSNQTLHALIECSPLAVYTLNREYRVTLWNPAAEKLFGWSAGEALNGPLPSVNEDTSEEARRYFDRIFNGQVLTGIEVDRIRKDGAPIQLSLSASPLYDADGNIAQAMIIALDITERRQAEQERQKLEARIQYAQKLESLGILAGGIAHDFNNLLMGVLGNANLAVRALSPENPAYLKLQKIETAAQRAADLTNQLLAYSGKGRFIIRALNLNRLVEEMTHLLDTVISKRATLKYHFHPVLPSMEGDATQIRQVIMNLITNASDAIGDQDGIINITTGVMQADVSYLVDSYVSDPQPAGTYVFCEVSDTGCGMDSATREKIFDPFFSTKFTGRGLGLAAVLGIVRGHRGAIKVYSEPGRGTAFKVLFPSTDATVEEAPEPCSSSYRVAPLSGTILVVDDEITVRDVAQTILSEAGFTVLLACDGKEGLEVYRKHRKEIVAVLLDMTMPVLSGEETFRELRKLDRMVRVILSSGYNEQDATNRFAGKGLSGFIQKPYLPELLIRKLREILSQ